MLGPDWKEGCRAVVVPTISRQRGAPGGARRQAVVVFAGPAGADRGVQKGDGLAVPLGVVECDRLQLRLPGVHARRSWRKARCTTTFHAAIPKRRTAWTSVFYRDGPATSSILFELRSRADILIGHTTGWTLQPKGRDEGGCNMGWLGATP